MISGPQNDWIFSHFLGLINLDMCSTERNISKFSLISWNTSTILPVWTHSFFILTPCYKNFISCQTSASKSMNLHFSHKFPQILYEVSGALIFSCCKTFTQVLQLVYTLSCNRPWNSLLWPHISKEKWLNIQSFCFLLFIFLVTYSFG